MTAEVKVTTQDVSGLLELASRCEVATGPDRELDAAIATGAGWQDVGRAGYGAWRGVRPATGKREHVMRFTASLDAAMTLVPEGWFVRITSAGACDIANSAWLEEEGEQQALYTDAATPALALCAASLRARASTDQGGSHNGK